MAIVESNKVSGVSTVTSTDSAVYKEHADNYITVNTYPSVSGNSGKYLFSNGSIQSWEQPTGSIEYRTGGSYTFTIPTSATKFYIEAISGGGGGSSATLGNPGFSGAGGASGSYASWFIPRQELGSATTISVGVGTGGPGGNCLGVSGSTDGIVWTQRVHPSLPTTGTPYNRTLFANSTHLIYGEGSRYATSTNSITWTARTLGTFINPLGATFGNSTYAMCGQTGVLLTSTNAVEWTSRTAGYTGNLQSIVFASTLSQFLYGGETGGTVATSTNAISWTLRTGPVGMDQSVSILAFGNGTYFAGYGGGRGVAISTNGINWVFRTAAVSDASSLNNYSCAVFGNNLWVIAGQTGASGSLLGLIQSSTDTIVWTIRTTGSATFSGTANTNPTGGLGNGGEPRRGAFATVNGVNTFILCGDRNTIITSTDTINWIVRTCAFKKVSSISDVSANTAGYLSVGAIATGGSTGLRSAVSWITDNQTTILASSGGSSNGGGGASGSTAGTNAAGNSGFDYNILYSINGVSGGTGITLPAAFADLTQASPYQSTPGGAGALNTGIGQSSITYSYGNSYGSGGSASGGDGLGGLPNSYTIPYGSGGSGGGALATGISAWYMRTSGLVGTTNGDVVFGASTYLIGSSNGRIATSTDTIAWTLRTLSASLGNNISTLAFGSNPTNTFVAAGSFTLLNTSTNGIQWTIRTAGFDGLSSVNDVIYTGATPLYLAGANTRALNTSTDAISWTLRTTGFGAAGGGNISGIAYAAALTQKFAITGTVRAVSTSTDAISWTVRTLGTASATMFTMSTGNNIFVTGGAGGRVFTSTNGIQWLARTAGLGSSPTIARIRFKNNYFIAGTNLDRTFRISTDAITWESAFYNRASTVLNGIDFNSSTYIGMCYDGTVVCGETTVQSAAGNGGNGTKGGGGGGGGYSNVVRGPSFGMGGDGGEGYVRITWW
jgi:hypothetical protein